MKITCVPKGYFLSAILILAACPYSHSQVLSKVDSLKQELGLRGESNRFNILWGLAYELFDVDNAQALIYAREAHKYALRAGDSLGIVKTGRITGQILRRLDKLDESIDALKEALAIARRLNIDSEMKLALNALAVAHTFRAEYDKALEYHFQALVIHEKEGNKKQASITLNNIGLVYFRFGNNDLALDYYLQSLVAKKEANDTFDLDRLYLNIGLTYVELRDYANAQDYLSKGFAICGSSCNNQIVIEGEIGFGKSYGEQGQLYKAKEHFNRSLDLSIRENNHRFQLENLIELTKVSLKEDNLEEAQAYLMQADKVPDVSEYSNMLVTLYELNADFSTKSGDFQKANEFLKKATELRNSIFNTEVVRNLTKVQTQYAQRENLAIIASKDEVLALNQEVIAQQRMFNWLLGAVIILTTALVLVIYRNYQGIKVVNGQLATAKRIIEEQNLFLDQEVKVKTKELVDTNESLTKVNDELDNFIYKTSHDIRGPLASLKGMVNLAIMDVKDEKAQGYLAKLDLTAEKLNMILTRLLIVNRINHAELKPEPILFEPIIQEILTLEMKKGVPEKINIEYEVAPETHLTSDKEMVRLILENLIDNAVKFYNESERVQSFVRIAVRLENGKTTVHVVDNGVGIAQMNREKIFQMFVRASERSDTGGIGLYLAKIATEKLGGDITLVSTSEKYTEFIVQFPESLQAILDKRNEEKKKHEKELMSTGAKQTVA